MYAVANHAVFDFRCFLARSASISVRFFVRVCYRSESDASSGCTEANALALHAPGYCALLLTCVGRTTLSVVARSSSIDISTAVAEPHC
jgi:hypothetical protein